MDGFFTSSSKKKKLKAKKELELKMANKETVATEQLAKDMVVEKEKAIVEAKTEAKAAVKKYGLWVAGGVVVLFIGYKIFIKKGKR